jgi:hypothetical protein
MNYLNSISDYLYYYNPFVRVKCEYCHKYFYPYEKYKPGEKGIYTCDYKCGLNYLKMKECEKKILSEEMKNIKI